MVSRKLSDHVGLKQHSATVVALDAWKKSQAPAPIGPSAPVSYHLFAPNAGGMYVRKPGRLSAEQLAALNNEGSHRSRLEALAKVVSDLKESHGRLSEYVYRGTRNLYKFPLP